MFNKLNDRELKKNALELAHDILPQGRVLRDVGEDEVAAVVVLAPYVVSEEHRWFEEMPSPPFASIKHFEECTEPSQFDSLILEEGTTIYGDPYEANRWHGTSLSIAQKALPGILTPDKVEEALDVGSAYGSELPEEEDEDEY